MDPCTVEVVYGIAISVAACLQAGTRADVAWLVDSDGLPVGDWSDAVVLTPGGGRIGSLAGGALDGKLGELAGRWSRGRVLELKIDDVDALIADLPTAGSARCVLVPADLLPAEVWDLATARETFCLVTLLDDGEVVAADVYSEHSISSADSEVRARFSDGAPGSTEIGDRLISVFKAVPQMVIVGSTPVGEALAQVAPILGWQAVVVGDVTRAMGLIAPLSRMDKVVVTAHDLELSGAALAAALDSVCGYIGSLGGRKMQEDRADWLAYRGVTDLGRIHGPAGLDIGAENPGEIAVAIVAEAIAEATAVS